MYSLKVISRSDITAAVVRKIVGVAARQKGPELSDTAETSDLPVPMPCSWHWGG